MAVLLISLHVDRKGEKRDKGEKIDGEPLVSIDFFLDLFHNNPYLNLHSAMAAATALVDHQLHCLTPF